jgi:hypothetical protein
MVATQHERAVRRRKHGVDQSPLNRWLRARGAPGEPLHPVVFRLTVVDIDAYVSRNVDGIEHWLLCECKSNGATMTPAQRYRLFELDRALSFAVAHGYDGSRYRGVHLLQLSGLDIETSQSLWLDGFPVTERDLVRFFRMEAPAEWYERRPWSVGGQSRDAVESAESLRYVVRDLLDIFAAESLSCPSLSHHLDAVIEQLRKVRAQLTRLERSNLDREGRGER